MPTELVERPPLHPNTFLRRPNDGHDEAPLPPPSPSRSQNRIAVIATCCLLMTALITLPHFQHHRTNIRTGAEGLISGVLKGSVSDAPQPAVGSVAPSAISTKRPAATAETPPPTTVAAIDSIDTAKARPPGPKGESKIDTAPSMKGARMVPDTVRAQGSWLRIPFGASGGGAGLLPLGCYPYTSITDVRVICMAPPSKESADNVTAGGEPPAKRDADPENGGGGTTAPGEEPSTPKKQRKKGKKSKRAAATDDGDTTVAAEGTEPKGKSEATTPSPPEEAAVRKMHVAKTLVEEAPDEASAATASALTFPLSFTVEHDARVVPLGVVCTSGCSKATILKGQQPSVKRLGESITSTLRITIESVADVVPDSPCARFVRQEGSSSVASLKDVCFFGFDFVVKMASSSDTAPAAPLPVCFLSVGDWGKSPGVDSVADAMTKEAVQGGDMIKFVISTGDNFYPTGVTSVQDPHWENTFEGPFCHPAMLFVKWLVCAGNHDQWGIKPQLQYSKLFNPKPSPSRRKGKCPSMRPPGFRSRWHFPSRLFALDVPLYTVNDASQQQQGALSSAVRVVTLDTYGKDTPKQVAFAESSFQADTQADSEVWRLLLNHAPVFSGSAHGQEPRTPVLRKALQPMLERRKVHMYLNGDDHVLEILRDPPLGGGDNENTTWATEYFVNGAGGGSHLYGSIKLPQTVYMTGNEKTKGFMKHCVKSVATKGGKMITELVTTALNDRNAVLFKHKTPFQQD